jgi:CRISPR/Cas system-associated exonuclease Cas4 (RecB family)
VVRIERILSPTAINTYLACPHKYYLRYIRKLRTKPSIHLIRGNLIHKTIQAFHKDCASGAQGLSKTEISESLLKTFHRLWQESKNDLCTLGLLKDELQEYHDDSERMLLNYADWFTRQETPPIVNYSEVKIFSDYLGLMGIIDAVRINGNEVTLIDYKTSKNPTVNDETMRQAVIYALLYKDRYNRVPDVVCIHFLKNPGDPIPIHIDELFLEYAEILVESIHEKTRTNDASSYPCTCGGYCERDFST